MYFTPELSDLCVNRGDSYSLPITINQGNILYYNPYILQEGDVIYVGITEPGQAFENAIIKKVITHNDAINDVYMFELLPQDTEYLMTGKYYIEMKLKHNDKVTTILTPKQFWITGTNPPQTLTNYN